MFKLTAVPFALGWYTGSILMFMITGIVEIQSDIAITAILLLLVYTKQVELL